MFIDANLVPNQTVIEADLCVIGAGAAGITIAQQFADTRIRVCLLESGGLAFDPEPQALAQGKSVGLPYTDLGSCQLRCFGGNTNAWGGWCRPLDPLDFERRPWVPDSGWPFAGAELARYYEGAHALCHVEDTSYDLHRGIAPLGERCDQVVDFDPAKLETTLYRFSPPTRFGKAYRGVIENAKNVQCLFRAHCLRIETTGDARHALRVPVGSLSGRRFDVTAKIFVLAAGAIENARLLLLSDDVVSAGLGNQNDLVGRFFMDHPHIERAIKLMPGGQRLGLYGLRHRRRGISARISLPAAVQEREQLVNYSANVYPIYPGQSSTGWLSFRDAVFTLDPRRAADPYFRFSLPFTRKKLVARQVLDIARELDRVALATVMQVAKPERYILGYTLQSKPEQAPNRDSRVTLHRDRDAFGLNRAQVEWRLLSIDRRTIDRAEAMIDMELRRLGIGELVPSPPARDETWPGRVAGGWHQMGTTRAHTDPRQGVVDANGRVHGMSNLFIAGASVFPTGGAATPTLTIVALALRLADHLRPKLPCR